MKNKFVAAMALISAMASVSGTALAQEWPHSVTTIVIPHDIASSQNVTTRALGTVWAEKLGTQFVYENREGASGRVGYDFFLGQPDDGSVLLSTQVAAGAMMYVQQKPDWNWDEELLPLGVFGVDPGAIFVRAESPYQTLQDVVEASKERKLTLGLSFWASPDNLQVHQIMEQAGADFEVIPNESSTELIAQILGGHLDVGYQKVGSILRGGEDLRILAVTLPTNPIGELTGNAPTVDEALGTTTLGSASYRGIMVRRAWAEANPDQYDLLRTTFAEAVSDPKFVEAMEAQGINRALIFNMPPDDVDALVVQAAWSAYEEYGHIYNN